MSITCLIGESDPFLARLLARFAEAAGLTTLYAQVGEEVLGMTRKDRPQVIIVEAELPGTLRGWEAVQAIQADPALCDIPIISCSWLTAVEAQALAGATVAHLQKPDLHYDDFLAALAQAGIELRRRRPSHSRRASGDGSPPAPYS